jgi:hypothetical protein
MVVQAAVMGGAILVSSSTLLLLASLGRPFTDASGSQPHE